MSRIPQSLPLRPVLALLVTAVAASSGCDAARDQSPLFDSKTIALLAWEGGDTLTPAQSCEEAEAQLRQSMKVRLLLDLEQQRRWWLDSDGRMYAATGGAEQSAAPGADATKSAPDAYSDTNVQVEGVDEGDIVKTDGLHIYALVGPDVVIARAWPPQDLSEAARVRVVGYPSELHRRGDQLIVLSQASLQQILGETASEKDPWRWLSVTIVTVLDVSDPAAPTFVSSFALEGWTSATRRIDGRVYLVLNDYRWPEGIDTWPEGLDWDAPEDEVNATFSALAAKNLAVLDDVLISEWLPRRWSLDAEGHATGPAQALTPCDAVFFPGGYAGYGLLTVASFDLDLGAAPTGTTVLGDWSTLYASRDALYTAVTNWGWYWWFDGDFDVRTRVHKFAYAEADGAALYRGSGTVVGHVLNQFSMDERDGVLRVATTDPQNWWWGSGEESESFVTCLEEQPSGLTPLGQLGGLGKGERIYSVRFVADKGYVVTFRQTDPLYVIDLSDAAAPTVAGELKIPGFSSYMHPLDADHLLTIGRDADDDGRVQGLQFQIFDVSDPTAPAQMHKTVLGDGWNTWSEALYDHHAFTYFPEREMLAIPVSSWTESEHGWGYDSELTLFQVSLDTGIQPAGAIDHDPLLGASATDDVYGCWDWYSRQAQVRRGVFMDEFIYSLSTVGLRVHDTTALEAGAVADLPLLELDAADGDYEHGYCWGW